MTNEEKRALVLERMKELGIPEKLFVHKAVYTMEELEETDKENPYLAEGASVKNLFLKEHNSDRYYLIVLTGNKRADIKEIRHYLGCKPMSFASEEELIGILGVTHGAVSPLCVMNDTMNRVTVVIDDDLRRGKLLGVHPCENTSTVYLSYEELDTFVRSCGHTLINMQVN